MNFFLYTCQRVLLTTLISTALVGVCLAESPVYLNTTEGTQRLVNADLNKPYFLVAPYVDTQENMGFCGPASIAAILNSLPEVPRPPATQYKPYAYFTQDSLFNSVTNQVKPYDVVAHNGLTLAEATKFIDAHGVAQHLYYGTDLSLDQLRTLIKTTLLDQHSRVIADFDRRVLGQEGSGHYSPVVAYDSTSDSILIADVAKFKYPPFWVSLPVFLASMQTIDPDSGKSRGLIVVSTLR